MADITRAHKSTVSVITEINASGTSLEWLTIDGQKMCVMGYTSPADRQAALDTVQRIIDNSTKEGPELWMEIAETLQAGAAIAEAGIEAKDSEEVEIEGVSVVINYVLGKAYLPERLELTEIANLDDLQCELPQEAAKALLVERARAVVKERLEEAAEHIAAYADYDEED